jgi:hypothetical protein
MKRKSNPVHHPAARAVPAPGAHAPLETAPRRSHGQPRRPSNQHALDVEAGVPVSRRSDPEEREADRVADVFVGSHRSTPLVTAGSRGLPASSRSSYEQFFGADLSKVRVHDHAEAHRAASALSARAFAYGGDVYLGAGAPDLSTSAGQRLIAHELSHVVQQRRNASRAGIMRQPIEGGGEVGAMCRAPQPQSAPLLFTPAQPERLMCELQRPAALMAPGSLEQRIAQFKEHVKTVAVQRMLGNIQTLDLWAPVIEKTLPDEVFAATGLAQSGGYGELIALQDIHNPATRQITASQIQGRNRACTGCHLLTQASVWGASQPHVGTEWMSPNERRAGARIPGFYFESMDPASTGPESAPRATGYTPPAGTPEGALMSAFPDMSRIDQLMSQARTIFSILGPDGYQVLPRHILDELNTRSMTDIRRDAVEMIRSRQSDYREVISRIRDGEMSWDLFSPIIQDLLTLADADVATAIRDELEANRRWEIAKAILIGLATLAAILIPIAAPAIAASMPALAAGLTVAGGVAELGLAAYGMYTGPEMMRTGESLSMTTGAHNVIDPAMQQSGGTMQLFGFLGIVLGPLGIYSGMSRVATGVAGLSSVGAEGAALTRAGQSIQRGEYILEMSQDGAIIATSTRDPSIMIIVRGDTATLYQSMGPGGMRVVSSVKLSEAAGAVGDVAGAPTGGTTLGGSPFSRRLLPSGVRTPDQEYAEFLQMLQGEGAAGPVQSGGPVTMQPHSAAREARDLLGVSGADVHSAHGFPQSTGAGLPGYNPRTALTTLQERAVHTAMDAFWKDAFQNLRRQGRTTASAQEIFDAVADSIGRAPFDAEYAGSLIQRLSDEMFVELGLQSNTQLPLPYPNIGP